MLILVYVTVTVVLGGGIVDVIVTVYLAVGVVDVMCKLVGDTIQGVKVRGFRVCGCAVAKGLSLLSVGPDKGRYLTTFNITVIFTIVVVTTDDTIFRGESV